MIRIGDEVVCVLGGRLADSSPNLFLFPVKGQTYHVRGVQTSPYKHLTGQIGILLEEIINDVNPHSGEEWDYFSKRFRKVVKLKGETSIEVFQKLLNPAPGKKKQEDKPKVKEKEKV